MEWLIDLLDALARVPVSLLLFTAWALAFAESGLGLGLVVPGETGVVILSTTVTGPGRFAAMVAVVSLGSTMGDHVGYLLGRRYGERLRHTRLVRRMGEESWERATAALHKYGPSAIYVTRLLPVVRSLTPAAAGVSQVRYVRFLPASLLGALTWAGLYVSVGALAGASAERIAKAVDTGGLILVTLLAAAAVVVWLLRRRTRRRISEDTEHPEHPGDDGGSDGGSDGER